MKNQSLSPRKYIETKARSLPIYKCWTTSDWKESGIADVIVSRKHVNGKITVGVYLVDLLCLGIKDTFYVFNEEEEGFLERMAQQAIDLQEIDYTLAHNIIYTGHDFAMEFDIHPHKEFQTTKFILEEDTDAIPLVDVPTGDEDGKPHLIVSPEYHYRPALEKLRKNAGEGNFHFTIGVDEEDEEEFDDEDDDETSDDFTDLSDIAEDDLNLSDLRYASVEELANALQGDGRSLTDKQLVAMELFVRSLAMEDERWTMSDEEVMDLPEYEAYDDSLGYDSDESENLVDDLVANFERLAGERPDKNDDLLLQRLLGGMATTVNQQIDCFLLLNLISPELLKEKWPELRQQSESFTPVVQLFFAGLAIAEWIPMHDIKKITESSTLREAFPDAEAFNSLHFVLFWTIKAIKALKEDDKEAIQKYHSLLSLEDLPAGHFRILYILAFSDWMSQQLPAIDKEEA